MEDYPVWCCYLLLLAQVVDFKANFQFRFADIDEEFKNSLRQFVLMLFSPKNLIPKEIGGQKIRVWELLSYFKFYKELFNCDDLPEPRSMLLVSLYLPNLPTYLPVVTCKIIFYIFSTTLHYRLQPKPIIYQRWLPEQNAFIITCWKLLKTTNPI